MTLLLLLLLQEKNKIKRGTKFGCLLQEKKKEKKTKQLPNLPFVCCKK
jgi:hypothetical protein